MEIIDDDTRCGNPRDDKLSTWTEMAENGEEGMEAEGEITGDEDVGEALPPKQDDLVFGRRAGRVWWKSPNIERGVCIDRFTVRWRFHTFTWTWWWCGCAASHDQGSSVITEGGLCLVRASGAFGYQPGPAQHRTPEGMELLGKRDERRDKWKSTGLLGDMMKGQREEMELDFGRKEWSGRLGIQETGQSCSAPLCLPHCAGHL
ncbi:hypothetical protein QBC45DRAFT_11026 [Copromyces sp. CBS 386.78]|nr:hypothetical protein QBC45DRAFT_11026 [Copromyces sp. CBS 386.78]